MKKMDGCGVCCMLEMYELVLAARNSSEGETK